VSFDRDPAGPRDTACLLFDNVDGDSHSVVCCFRLFVVFGCFDVFGCFGVFGCFRLFLVVLMFSVVLMF
jgi:hypothetical protein